MLVLSVGCASDAVRNNAARDAVRGGHVIKAAQQDVMVVVDDSNQECLVVAVLDGEARHLIDFTIKASRLENISVYTYNGLKRIQIVDRQGDGYPDVELVYVDDRLVQSAKIVEVKKEPVARRNGDTH